MIGSLSLKLGIINNLHVDTKIEELLDRPTEETATMFSFVKQQFYHKSLAYTKYEKNKVNKQNNKKCCWNWTRFITFVINKNLMC